MRKQVALALGALALFSTTSVSAQPLPMAEAESVGMSSERLDRIGQVFQQEIDSGALPGAVVMVARDGKLVYSAVLGMEDPQAGEPMQEDSIFRLYSMTKPLVSVAAMILMEEGKLHLAEPVAKYLPEFADLEVSVPETDGDGKTTYSNVPLKRPMTVQDLLRHTAGLAYGELTRNPEVQQAYAEAGVFNPGGMPFDARGVAPDEQVAGLGKAPLVNQPGEVWQYGLATDVLGRVIERVSGMALAEFLEARVFGPLKMDSTGFYVPENAMERLAESFATNAAGAPIALIDVSAPPANASGGGGAVSTAGDYLRFNQMLLQGGDLEGVQVLSPTSVKLMTADHLGERIQTPLTPGEPMMGVHGYTFGLGFMVREEDGIAGVPGSQGEYMWAGYAGTFFWVDPEEKLTAVLMAQMPGPTAAHYRRLVKQLVYQAIIDAGKDRPLIQ
jgi:CubicO group peptidase (beta-lactamase class C family)